MSKVNTDPQIDLYKRMIYGPGPYYQSARPDEPPMCQREPWWRQFRYVPPARHTMMSVNGSIGVVRRDIIGTIMKRQWILDELRFLNLWKERQSRILAEKRKHHDNASSHRVRDVRVRRRHHS